MNDNEELKKFKLAKPNFISELECKICKDLPSGPKVIVQCCGRILGCQECLTRALREHPICPLCRAEAPRSMVINGLDSIYSYLHD